MWKYDEERFLVFSESLRSPLPKALSDFYEEEVKKGIPVIERDTMALLSFLIKMKGAKSILEIGSATGFSASFIEYSSSEEAHITSIEYDEGMADEAEKNWERLQIRERIDFIRGDAVNVLKELKMPYDFIFLDSAKGQYPVLFPDIKRLLEKGGILFADNVSMEGRITESRFFVERRDRTIHERIRTFLSDISGDDDFETDLLPVGDGVLLALKTK